MIVRVDRGGTVEGFNDIITTIVADKTVKGLLILACDANGFVPDDLDEILKGVPVPLFGGVFPAIIHGKDRLEKGVIVAGISMEPNIHIIHSLSDMSVDYDDVIDEQIPETGKTKTMFVFVDGISRRISALVDSLFNAFGSEFNYIGGGAGSLSFVQKPCLFTNEGLIQDSALLAMVDMDSGVGVSHGWEEIGGPYRVTESDRNVIKTLDLRPAFQVYREAVESHSNEVFKEGNFLDIAKRYPFGISKLGTEKIVRDPFVLGEDDYLTCVGEVPKGAYVDILTGDVSSLVDAASKARTLGENAFKTKSANKTILFIDCISRVLFLEDEFGQELNAVSTEATPLIGALTLGEIANSGKDYLEFYNKTSVIGVLGD